MKFVASTGGVAKPVGILQGPKGNIPISSIEVSLAVGTLPSCRIGLAPELLNEIPKEQTQDLYRVAVGDGSPEHTLFRGYVSGESGRVDGRGIMSGITLVHPARDMDEMRISAPDLHPSGVNDFNYIYFGNNASATASGFMFSATPYYKAGGGPLASQILQGLIGTLKSLGSADQRDFGFKIQSSAAAIKLLSQIKVKNGTLNAGFDSDFAPSINQWCQTQITGSFNSMRSIWDTVSSTLARFGLMLNCDYDGNVYVLVDCTAMTPPAGNFLGENYVASFDHNSTLIRNIKEVNLLCDAMSVSEDSASTFANSLVTYPKPGGKAAHGASLSLLMPGWLNPIAVKDSPKASVREAQRAYAQSQFYIERNKMKTMALAGPLAPQVVPGTTATIRPWSALHTFSGLSVDFLRKTYAGYCYQINHVMDAKTMTLQTTFYFRNVTDVTANETIKKHPLFSDVKPHEWV